jgi:hypothetical protein
VVLHSNRLALAKLYARALAPEAHVVAAQGNWVLLESTLATVPVTAPDAPAPSPCPGLTLGARVERSLRRL